MPRQLAVSRALASVVAPVPLKAELRINRENLAIPPALDPVAPKGLDTAPQFCGSKNCIADRSDRLVNRSTAMVCWSR